MGRGASRAELKQPASPGSALHLPPPLPNEATPPLPADDEAPPIHQDFSLLDAMATAGGQIQAAGHWRQANAEVYDQGAAVPPCPPPVRYTDPEVLEGMSREVLAKMEGLAELYGFDLHGEGQPPARGPRLFALCEFMHRSVAAEFDEGFDSDPEDVVARPIESLPGYGSLMAGRGPEDSPSSLNEEEVGTMPTMHHAPMLPCIMSCALSKSVSQSVLVIVNPPSWAVSVGGTAPLPPYSTYRLVTSLRS